MTGREHSELMNIRGELRAVLHDAAKLRHQRRDPVDTAVGEYPGWVVHERKVMLAHVNRIRRDHDWAPVKIEAITRLDNSAAGHCDWFEKFTFHCAELAYGLEPARRG